MKLPPPFIFCCLSLLNYSTRSTFSPILPLIQDNLSISHGQAGGFFPSLSIGFSISLLLSGWFVSLWGNKKTVIIGLVGSVLSRELIYHPSFPLLQKLMIPDIGEKRFDFITPLMGGAALGARDEIGCIVVFLCHG